MDKLVKCFTVCGGIAGAALVLVLTALMTTNVIGRYVFRAPFIFTDEVSTYLFLGVVFLGLGYTMREKGHVRVDMLFSRFPVRVQSFMEIIFHMLFIVYTLALLSGTIFLLWNYYTRNIVAFTSLATPLFWPGLLMPIGLLILFLQLVEEICHHQK